jgi:hypothetical protein
MGTHDSATHASPNKISKCFDRDRKLLPTSADFKENALAEMKPSTKHIINWKSKTLQNSHEHCGYIFCN